MLPQLQLRASREPDSPGFKPYIPRVKIFLAALIVSKYLNSHYLENGSKKIGRKPS
jgi:hypothetical protein